jgi:hypothetical protein
MFVASVYLLSVGIQVIPPFHLTIGNVQVTRIKAWSPIGSYASSAVVTGGVCLGCVYLRRGQRLAQTYGVGLYGKFSTTVPVPFAGV